MTVSTATREVKARAKKPEGQWRIDGTDPLNHDEEVKQREPVMEVKQRVIDTYAKGGFDSIDREDLYPRFKWLGLYTQRKQNLGGEHTGEDNSVLEDKYFMMRIRFDGGICSTEQARVVGEISRDYARSTVDLTDRQNIQLHWVRIEDVPTIWEKLEAVGLNTWDACGDVPRVVLGSPVAGIAKDEIIDATPAIRKIQEIVTDEEFQNLPRKFKSAISGNARQDVVHEINDLAFIGVEHPELGPGFECYVGGGLSTNPMLAQSLGAFVTLEQVPEVWAAVVRIFRDYGYRRLRNRARLKFLVAKWGAAKFREVLETEYLGYALPDGPKAPNNLIDRDHIGVHEQKDGNVYVGVKPTLGHMSGEQLIEVADVVERYGSTSLRFTPFKELLVLDIAPERVDALQADLEALGLYAKPSEFRRGLLSCTGLEYCKLAHVTTKSRAIELADELEERFGDLDSPITISLNGCPNACARHHVSDIGLKGQTVTNADGERVEGFQVHLGGTVGEGANFGRKLRGHKVASTELTDYVTRVVQNYVDNREEGELFRDFLLRADEEQLR
ncbi:sulfite reductase (hemoprotein) [Corynebacterium imitans]|uniref:assimilatory sulfite reductase (ferredoxin) n=1 Tax=Corynebacterium imitans TaxID=156978 RepID=A0A076NLP9_9CORY|nr:nitrite/sulfite reductase [Corynebacterium imitans]AIJ34298.1 sulfite reductase [Corynebacterium imitans]MDK8306953.1 nitrite/sulfite reductase [Corynebacterium imitans]MDK8638106.1 nitrite/sulfite reductase [Corynebacterium imitans]MDK8773110.1 nitrite/sulfite reductase [Corynebacterium imitans]SNV84411.1 sulfite reductase (hemoprotein) [Corynebacterium imitans]